MDAIVPPLPEPELPNDDPGAPLARDPRREAQAAVGDGHHALVLEPSPPAVTGELFADDPVAVPARSVGRLVSPVPGRDLTWESWIQDHPTHASWAAARWLGAYRRLPAPPPTYAETRGALHRLAVYVVSPARRRVNGKIGLRFTLGGMGTPFFGADEQVRVAGTRILRQRAGAATAEPITTVARAATFVLEDAPDAAWADGFDVPPLGDPDEQLPVDAAAAAFFGDWCGFAWSVLESLRAEPESVGAGRVQLWPEHFDAAFDCRPGGAAATFGASPGDSATEEPYLYVLPQDLGDGASDERWNATSFRGAILRLSDFVDEDDQRAVALAFFRSRRAELGS